MPNDNIERARKRGGGEEAGGADRQNITYEGYGPNGVALLIECLTDNRNRAAGEVRTAMTRNGGNMADPGSVAYLFTRGVVTLEFGRPIRGRRLDGRPRRGCRRGQRPGESFEVVSEPTDLVAVRTPCRRPGSNYDSAEADFRALRRVPVDADGARKVCSNWIDALEDCDDVQDVASNVDIPDEVLAQLDDGSPRVSVRRSVGPSQTVEQLFARREGPTMHG